MELIKRETIYLWYYTEVQLRQLFVYWLIGILIGSFISVFAKDKIHKIMSETNEKKWGLFGIIPACILGIISPLCMYGTIPIAASFEKKRNERRLYSIILYGFYTSKSSAYNI